MINNTDKRCPFILSCNWESKRQTNWQRTCYKSPGKWRKTTPNLMRFWEPEDDNAQKLNTNPMCLLWKTSRDAKQTRVWTLSKHNLFTRILWGKMETTIGTITKCSHCHIFNYQNLTKRNFVLWMTLIKASKPQVCANWAGSSCHIIRQLIWEHFNLRPAYF